MSVVASRSSWRMRSMKKEPEIDADIDLPERRVELDAVHDLDAALQDDVLRAQVAVTVTHQCCPRAPDELVAPAAEHRLSQPLGGVGVGAEVGGCVLRRQAGDCRRSGLWCAP
jgi:hypothetical protein